MNTVYSADSKLAKNDENKFLGEEVAKADNPPPYEYEPISTPRSSAQLPSVHVVNELHMNVQQPAARTLGNHYVGPKRITMFCPNCQSSIKTETDTKHKCCTHCCCIFLFLTLILGPCCCLPYCCFSPEKVVHTCPNCRSHIGTYYG